MIHSLRPEEKPVPDLQPPLLRRMPVLALALAFSCLMAGCAPTSHLMPLADGTAHLAPCPAAPHCVTSRPGTRERDRIDALQAGRDAQEAHARLLAVLAADPAFEVLGDDGRYVHTEYTTGLMRYRDDVEFLIRDDGSIDVRSSARIGWYDWGVNRNRVEALREALTRAGS